MSLVAQKLSASPAFVRRERGKTTTPWQPPRKGCYRWLSPVVQVRVRLERARGSRTGRLARQHGISVRTIYRVLTDAWGIRLARRLAATGSLWVLLPDVLETIRDGAALAPVLEALVARLQAQPSSGVSDVVRTRALAAVRRFQERCTPAVVVWGPAHVTPPMTR